MRRFREPTIEHYIKRYRLNKWLLEKYPKNKELLERKIKEAEQKIVEYFTSDSFVNSLKYIKRRRF